MSEIKKIIIELYKSLEGLIAERECLIQDIEMEENSIERMNMMDRLTLLNKEIEEWQS